MPRQRRTPTTTELLLELSKRPAMNGGFQKLAAQQDEQSESIKRLEAWVAKWDKRWMWILGAVGTIAISVIGRLVGDLVRAVLH